MVAIRILGRVALVTLFIFALVAVALAQDNAAQTPAVFVDDQIATNNTVTVRQVTAPQAAFLVIQRDLGGVPGPVIGQIPVAVGTTENVVIPLTEAVAPGNVLYAALYVDAGQLGLFEVPGADAPFVLNDQTLAQPFTIAAASSDQQTPPDQAPLSPLATVTSTVSVSPTVAVSPTLSVTPTVEATPQGQQVEVTPTVQPTIQDVQATPTAQLQEQPATPTVQPTLEIQVTPTVMVDVQATASAVATSEQVAQPAQPQQPDPGSPTPALMPVTGASGTANLPTTLLISAFAFVLFVGGNRFLQRLHSK